MTENDPLRAARIEVELACSLNPWGVKAKLINLSLTGALIDCENFPDDLLTTVAGELQIGELRLSGDFIRVNKLKIAIEFTNLTSSAKEEIEKILASAS